MLDTPELMAVSKSSLKIIFNSNIILLNTCNYLFFWGPGLDLELSWEIYTKTNEKDQGPKRQIIINDIETDSH